MLRFIVLSLLVVAVASPLGACGRKASLDRPDGATYPRDYPTK